jgi:hypothetical protein
MHSHNLNNEFGCADDLAALEWARTDIFDESDREPLSREQILGSATSSEPLRLTTIVAQRLLELDRAVLPLWRTLADDETAPPIQPSGELGAAIVWRKGFGVMHRSLAPDEEACLRAISEEALPLNELAELLIAKQPDCDSIDQAAERLAAILGRWASDELLTGT